MKIKRKNIFTSIGKIAVYIKEKPLNETPVIFLHGLYFDHKLWKHYIYSITDRTVIAVDMPLHGKSQEDIKNGWNLEDCAQMLVDILNNLEIPKAIAVGHSWGSMSILRAANQYPERFAAIGLCNMPFQAASAKQKILQHLQHSLLLFRNFYSKQAAKVLFAKNSLRKNPLLFYHLKRPMALLSNQQIREIDQTVILDPTDASDLIQNLKVKAYAINGKDDFVPASIFLETIIVNGGHVSPLESPNEVSNLISKLIKYGTLELIPA